MVALGAVVCLSPGPSCHDAIIAFLFPFDLTWFISLLLMVTASCGCDYGGCDGNHLSTGCQRPTRESNSTSGRPEIEGSKVDGMVPVVIPAAFELSRRRGQRFVSLEGG